MGRIYITGIKEFSITQRRVATKYEVYNDLLKTELVTAGTETDVEYLDEVRFSAKVGGVDYIVHRDTTARVKFVYQNGDESEWYDVKANTNCKFGIGV